MAVIALGDNESNRLGLIDPYKRILFWFCYKCPARNALCSMHRHLAGLLMGLSFQQYFKSTAKDYSLLNPVALESNQCLIALPMGQQSQEIPQHDGRRSRDTRNASTNPLYAQQRSMSSGPITSGTRGSSRGRTRVTSRSRGTPRSRGTSSSGRGRGSGGTQSSGTRSASAGAQPQSSQTVILRPGKVLRIYH